MELGRPAVHDLTQAQTILETRRVVLLDFDGPVCSVFGTLTNVSAAQRMRERFSVATGLVDSSDPFDVLRYVIDNVPGAAVEAEYELTAIETEAVRNAPQTPGAHEAIRYLAARKAVAIVSNNSRQCIREYLRIHNLGHEISAVSGRYSEDLSLLKPNAHLLQLALLDLGARPSEGCFIGDSVFDMQAAHAANVAPIAFAAKPGRAALLAPHDPAATVTSMHELIPG